MTISFSSSPLVSAELGELFAALLHHNISPWYEGGISDDPDFPARLLEVLAFACGELERRLLRVDWVALLCRDVPGVLTRHLADYRRCVGSVGTSYAGVQGGVVEDLFHGLQPHLALQPGISGFGAGAGAGAGGEEVVAEEEYMRQIVDLLMELLVPQEELQSDCVRYLLREILISGGFKVLLDSLTDPENLQLLLLGVGWGSFSPRGEPWASLTPSARCPTPDGPDARGGRNGGPGRPHPLPGLPGRP
jgi:hypothetical protein